ncbi:MAG: Hint domain-containing protein [Chloroflexi bacterium]|nr:Hint domain-containing protein [Chloroflexota bacterium]
MQYQRKFRDNIKCLWLVSTTLLVLLSGCATPQATINVTPLVEYSLPELKYRVIANFNDVFWTDPDFYPVAREGQEQLNAREQFPAIKADQAEFSAILKQLGLPDKAEYSDKEKLEIYRQHKLLTLGVQLTTAGNIYNFVIRVGEEQGERIEGTITKDGKIRITKREPSFNTRPICLSAGTMIDTPTGTVPVEQVRSGMTVWTADREGKQIPALVVRTLSTPVPIAFRIIRVTLSDGRSVTASPGHPTPDGRALVDYRFGDTLDGAIITATEFLDYDGFTYDLLPAGETGLYRTNGILLKSTLIIGAE